DLLNVAQALEVRMLYQVKYKTGWNGYESINRIVDYLLFIQSLFAMLEALSPAKVYRQRYGRCLLIFVKNVDAGKLFAMFAIISMDRNGAGMQETNILWADDEIDLLKPHIMLLNEKGYGVKTVTNGNDAVDAFKKGFYDLVFLDENMPGLTGLETLSALKNINPGIPMVLVTKNEEEHLMEDANGSKIDDYLIKPVNPKQILLTIKKLTENKRLISEKTSMAYQQDFR